MIMIIIVLSTIMFKNEMGILFHFENGKKVDDSWTIRRVGCNC